MHILCCSCPQVPAPPSDGSMHGNSCRQHTHFPCSSDTVQNRARGQGCDSDPVCCFTPSVSEPSCTQGAFTPDLLTSTDLYFRAHSCGGKCHRKRQIIPLILCRESILPWKNAQRWRQLLSSLLGYL